VAPLGRTGRSLTPPQTLNEVAPIVALDFSEPYGTLVSAAADEPSPRVWDLLTGESVGTLRGHTRGGVKCLQVEEMTCATGGADGAVRLWDLRRVGLDEDEEAGEPGWDLAEERSEFGEFGEARSVRSDAASELHRKDSTCVRVLEGHSRPVTALYFEDECLVGPPARGRRSAALTRTTGHRRGG
jgi:division protein 1